MEAQLKKAKSGQTLRKTLQMVKRVRLQNRLPQEAVKPPLFQTFETEFFKVLVYIIQGTALHCLGDVSGAGTICESYTHHFCSP